MPNLQNFNDIYADLVESAYKGSRPNSFGSPTKAQQQKFDSGQVISFDYSQSQKENIGTAKDPIWQTTQGGTNLPNNGQVYLQPDNIFMSDSSTGLNSYYVTNTADPNQATQGYFVVRGSDSWGNITSLNKLPDQIDAHNMQTDWIDSDLRYALTNEEIGQAKAAKIALQDRMDATPNVKIDVTGHSLGTIASIEMVASLDPKYIDQIGHVVLFDGPDARDAINKMGAQARANIAKLEAKGKIDYYVNPFDIVSMLNRNNGNEIGNVHFIRPKNYNPTFDVSDSAHDFGEFNMKKDGTPELADRQKDPDIFAYGKMLSDWEKDAIETLRKITGNKESTDSLLNILIGIVGDKEALRKFTQNIQDFGLNHLIQSTENITKIVALLQAAGVNVDAKWVMAHIGDVKHLINDILPQFNNLNEMYSPDIATYQQELKTGKDAKGQPLSGKARIKLEKKLVDEVAKAAKAAGDEYSHELTPLLSAAKTEIQEKINTAIKSAQSVCSYLTYSEIRGLFAGYSRVEDFWDDKLESDDKSYGEDYKENLKDFSEALTEVAENLQAFDKNGSKSFVSDYQNLKGMQ